MGHGQPTTGTAAELRELIREAHMATKDAREAIKELSAARREIDALTTRVLATLRNALHGELNETIQKAVNVKMDRLETEMDELIAAGDQKLEERYSQILNALNTEVFAGMSLPDVAELRKQLRHLAKEGSLEAAIGLSERGQFEYRTETLPPFSMHQIAAGRKSHDQRRNRR